MIDQGVIETGDKRKAIARADVHKLKKLLDELNVMYIVDDVMFGSRCDEAERIKDASEPKMRRVKDDTSISPGDGLGHREQTAFREFIISQFLLIDVFSLAQLDDEEAEFLGNLIYDTEY
jgi:hypothetical protein